MILTSLGGMGVCANLVLIAIILIKRPLRRFDGEYYLLNPQQTEYIITSPKSHLNNISGGVRDLSFTRLWWIVPGRIFTIRYLLPIIADVHNPIPQS